MKISSKGVVRDMTSEEEEAYLARTAPKKRHIRIEFQRRVDAEYPMERQLRILRKQNASQLSDMNTFFDNLESKRDVLLGTLQRDYKDDKNWI